MHIMLHWIPNVTDEAFWCKIRKTVAKGAQAHYLCDEAPYMKALLLFVAYEQAYHCAQDTKNALTD